MEQLLGDIQAGGWPAPAPIEQRWSAGSASAMSPAAGNQVTSWVGIIMYLPDDDPVARASITTRCDTTAMGTGFRVHRQFLGFLVTEFGSNHGPGSGE